MANLFLNMCECLRCPKCGRAGKVIIDPDFWDIERANCRFCNYKLPVYDGIPDFAEHITLIDPKLSPAQKLMNSFLVAYLYESPIWRPLHTRIGSGISLEKEVQEVLELSGAAPVHQVADLACGTGYYARAFARRFPEALVYGLDISLNMLSRGRRVARRQGLKTIMFLRGDIYLLPFDDNSLDRINCGGTLHLFSNLTPIWREVFRVLKPGGVFTAMTITLARGVIRKVQQSIVDRNRATFFQPDQLAADLSAAGLSSFKCMQHRVSLIFRAVKDSDQGSCKGNHASYREL
jgi:SAM-dependent methyltransferase